MKKNYEEPQLCKIEFSVEEAMMASIIDPTPGVSGTEIGGSKIELF